MSRTGLYVPLDAHYQDDPKVCGLDPYSELAYIRGLTLAKRTRSGGFIDTRQVDRLCDGMTSPGDVAHRLVEAGLWLEVEDGYQIHAWEDHNPATTDSTNAERQQRYRENKKRNAVTADNERYVTLRDNREEKKRDREEKRENTPAVPRPSELELAAFVAFWQIYPRKRNKPAARKAHRAAMKRADPDDIVAGAQLWAAHWEQERTEERFVPHPGTWLNGDQWNDPPPAGKRAAEPRGLANFRRVLANRASVAIDTTAACLNDIATAPIAVSERYL
jgi:hypothetical protein